MSERARPNFQKLVDYLNQQENPRQTLAYMIALLSWGKRGAAPGAGNTGDGRVEQIDKAVSTSIVNENKEDCKR
ncbi:Uncharacterised protein [uncultured Flavonifractor sp.]|nr:Uncharacterised protein [uncultured Flavonifractor sp.]